MTSNFLLTFIYLVNYIYKKKSRTKTRACPEFYSFCFFSLFEPFFVLYRTIDILLVGSGLLKIKQKKKNQKIKKSKLK